MSQANDNKLPQESAHESSSTNRRARRRRGELITRTVPLRISEAYNRKTGELIPLKALSERFAWLQQLIISAAQEGINQQWSEEGLRKFQRPDLSSYAFKAYQQAYGRLQPQGAYYDSRAKWVSEEIAGRTLRSTHYQIQAIEDLLAGSLESVTDPVTRRNLERRIRKYEQVNKRKPSDFFELSPVAPILSNPVIILSCVDKQFARVSVNPEATILSLDVKLPAVRTPMKARDWEWHTLHLPIPEYVQNLLLDNPENSLRLPNIRIKQNKDPNVGQRILFDVPLEIVAKPEHLERLKTSAKRVLAFDWGERRLLTGAVLEIQEDGTIQEVAGPFTCDTRKAQSRMMRQRYQARHLTKKVQRIKDYYARGDNNIEPLHSVYLPMSVSEKLHALEIECKRNWAAHHQLQKQTGHHAANWAVELALEYECDTITIEDLKSLEPRLKGLNKLRDRLNHQTRGQLKQYLSEKAEREGIKVMSVYARGTSSCCPRCGDEHKHVKAPDNYASGRGWSSCGCGSQLDRDHAAALRIGSRALTDKTGKKPTKPVKCRKTKVYKSKPDVILMAQSKTPEPLLFTESSSKFSPSFSHLSSARGRLNGVRNRVTVASIIGQAPQSIESHPIPQFTKSSNAWPGYQLMITNTTSRKT